MFSTLDIKGAFHSLNVAEGSRQYLHVCPYPSGRMLRYKKLAMGLKISPSEWGSCIDNILENVEELGKNIVIMADDILIYSQTPPGPSKTYK